MFCGNCGMKNDDSSVFCIGCGAKLTEDSVPFAPPESTPPVFSDNPVAPPPKGNNKKTLVAIGAAIVAVVVALILIFTLSGNGASSPKAVVEKYIKAMEKGDGKAALKLMHKDVIGDKDDQKEFIENFEDQMDGMMEDYNVEFEILEVEDVDNDELEDIQDEYDDKYDLKVKDAKYVIVEMSMSFMGYDYTQEMDLLVVKIGGKWYMGGT